MPITPALAALSLALLLGVLGLFQLALVAGAPLGRFAWGGDIGCCRVRSASAASSQF